MSFSCLSLLAYFLSQIKYKKVKRIFVFMTNELQAQLDPGA